MPRKELGEIIPTSVTLGNTIDSNHRAEHAIDGDLSTLAGTLTDTDSGWMKFEFDKVHFIHKMIIYYWFYTDWFNPAANCVQSEAAFMGCVNNDNNVDVSVYQGETLQKPCGTLQLTYGLKQSDQIYTLICNAEGDTVKFSKNTGVIALFEVVFVRLSESR